MIKLTVYNAKEFFQAVNGCSGAVYLIHEDGKRENLNKQYDLQQELQRKHKENKNYLKLALDLPNPKDYLRIVYYSIGNV